MTMILSSSMCVRAFGHVLYLAMIVGALYQESPGDDGVDGDRVVLTCGVEGRVTPRGIDNVLISGEPIHAWIKIADSVRQRAAAEQAKEVRDSRRGSYSTAVVGTGANGGGESISVVLLPSLARWGEYLAVSIDRVVQDLNGDITYLPWIDELALADVIVEATIGAAADQSRALGGSGIVLPLSLSPSVSAMMTPGDYVVRATFDSRACELVGVWKGVAIAQPAAVQVRVASEDDITYLATARAHYFAARGQSVDVLIEADIAIARDPARGRSLYRLRSVAKEKLGDLAGAVADLETYLESLKGGVGIGRILQRESSRLQQLRQRLAEQLTDEG